MKDHIETHIQKLFKYGNDMVKTLRNMSYTPDPVGSAPIRKLVDVPPGDTLTTMVQWELQQEQDGYNIEYKEQIKLHNLQKEIFKDNKVKAYVIIFQYCNKVMQNRIKETPDFETRIRDDPLELLQEIKKKMYDPARSKYKYATLCKSFKRIFNTKQENDEALVDYTMCFKQL